MSYVNFWEDDEGSIIMWLENEDGDIIRILEDEEEIQFHLTPYLKRKREETNEDDDWEDDNFKVIQGVRHIKTRYGLIIDDEQDTDMEQLTKKMKLCAHNEKKRKAMD